MDELQPVLRKFVKAMDALDIPYVIVGGFAIAGWGRYRATRDIDVIMRLSENAVPRLVRALRKGGFTMAAEDILDALRQKGHFSIFDASSTYHVDAKGVYGKKEARTLQSRITVNVHDYKIPISGLEDTIANKLRFGREQDLEDALAIMVRNRDALKMDVLLALCTDYGLLEELRALEKRAKTREAGERKPDRHR